MGIFSLSGRSFEVDGNGIKPEDVSELEKAEIAFFISLEQPTPAMVPRRSASRVRNWNGSLACELKFSRFGRFRSAGIAAQINDVLHRGQRAEHPDYEPDLNFKKVKAEADSEQSNLL
jgi:hypothetical protein